MTKTTEGANKLLLQNMLTIGPEHEKYKIQPRIQRATLLTLPLVDPEISNTEIFIIFCIMVMSTEWWTSFIKMQASRM